MAKNDWKALQAQFEHDHDKYGTSAKDWCEAKGLNYQSARRYIKVRTAQNDNAQTAQKRSAQSKTAQSAQKKAKQEKSKSARKKTKQDKSDSSNSTDADVKKPQADKPQRDDKGLFLPGNTVSIGCPGNTGEPTNAFKHGNQAARRSGIYSRLFPESKVEMFEYSRNATLEDELELTRTRMQAGIEFLNRVVDDMVAANTVEEKISLYDNYQKTENRLDVLTARIESLTKTMSSLGIDVVNKDKIIEDTKRIKNASRKLALEADALQKDGQGDDTPIADIVSDIQSMSKSGLMSE